jgi:hypothetical protein
MKPDSIYISKKDNKTIIKIPDEVFFDDGTKLTFSDQKTKGFGVGGWYKNAAGEEFMVKFGDSSSHIENMFNRLAAISVGEEYAVQTVIGSAVFNGRNQPFFAVRKIEDYQDIVEIKDIAVKKAHAPKFHPFYVFNALISNDDLNEENIGLVGDESPMVIDYGMVPRFLYPEQIEYAEMPFTLASFIGHRNLNGMQLVRRRYFGHDDFLLPEPFKLQKFKPADISYGSILRGVKKIVENKEQIIETIKESLQKLAEDKSISDEERERYKQQYSSFAEIMEKRIFWMEESFREDLAMVDNPEYQERFDKMKWRLMPEFAELMQAEEKIFKKCAQTDLDKNFAILVSEFLEKPTDEKRSREEILALDLRTVEKDYVKKFVGDKFMLHDALIAGDFELAKWITQNDLADINSNRTTRNHNYQFFRLTPLHTAIAIYHDKLHSGVKSELKPLEEMIDILQEKFFVQNVSFSQRVSNLFLSFFPKDGKGDLFGDEPKLKSILTNCQEGNKISDEDAVVAVNTLLKFIKESSLNEITKDTAAKDRDKILSAIVREFEKNDTYPLVFRKNPQNSPNGPDDFSPAGLTFLAYNNFIQKASEKAVATTTIQRVFRDGVEKLKPDSENVIAK